jgi:TonB-linked SusC/RagA family outer membrane protein
MKYIKINILLPTILLFLSEVVSAQDTQAKMLNQQVDTVQITPKSEIVHVAYGESKKEDLITGVSYLNVDELMQKNNMNTTGIQLSSLIQGLNGNIWGSTGLTLVDGLPRDFGNIMPSEIEQITVLKGVAAVALYGSKAAKGIMLITTKRGIKNTSQFRAWVDKGIYVPITYPKYLGSAEYMTLYNEARTNDGLTPLYDNETIYNSASGTNPYRYPDVDYYSSEYLKKYTNRTTLATEFRGGGEWARFYANMGYYKTNSLLDVGKGKDESVSRFHVRGNVDMTISDKISAKVNTSMAFYNTAFAKGNYWGSAASLRPNRYTPLIPISYLEGSDAVSQTMVADNPFLIDGKYLLGGIQQQTSNPFADLYTQGLSKYTARQYQFDVTLNFDLSSFAKGLSFRSQYGVDYYSRYTVDEDINQYAVYEPIWNNYAGIDQITSLTKYNINKAAKLRSLTGSYEYQKTFFSGIFDFDRTYNKVHNVSGKLLATVYQQTIAEQYHKDASANLGFQMQYNFDQKYYLDFTEAAIHSAKLAPGHRTAFSPTFSMGWRIKKENFMSNINFIDDLKLTASAGILNSDLDIGNYYQYTGLYTRTGDYRWNEGFTVQATEIQRGENDQLDFVKRKEVNLGLETSLFHNKLSLNASYYYTVMDGRFIIDGNAYPSYFTYGSTNFIPYTNYDSDLFKGVDLGITIKQKVGNVDLQLGIIGNYSTNKATKRSENYEFDYQTRIGKPTDGMWGLVSDGFFMNQSEIDNSPSQTYYGTVIAGDIKYKDQNGDGRIDDNDRIYLGRWGAPFLGGVNLTAKWKNFTLFTLFSGSCGGYGMRSNDFYRVNGEDKYSDIVRDRTIIAKDDNGKWAVTQLGSYPALTTTSGNNNFRDSDYWRYKTDRIDLSQIQLTYKLPTSLLDKVFLDDLDIFINGSNLLTIAKERQILTTNIGSSPQSRYFGLGLKTNF